MNNTRNRSTRKSFYNACLRIRARQVYYSDRNQSESMKLLKELAKGYVKDFETEEELFELGLEAFNVVDEHVANCIDTFCDNIDSYVYAKFQNEEFE